MNFSKKIVLSIISIQTISLVIFLLLGHYQYKTILDLEIKNSIEDTNFQLDKVVDELFREYTDHTGTEVLSNEKIVNAFVKGQREELLKLTLPIFKHLQEHNQYLNIMNFHTKDGHNFLRVQKPGVFGDDLREVRPMIAKTNETHKTQSGIEAGKYAISYRVMTPVFYENEYVGSFEFGVDIRHIISDLSTPDTKTPLFMMPKESVSKIYGHDKNADKYLAPFGSGYAIIKFVRRSDNNESLLDIIDTRIVNEGSYLKSYHGREYLIYKSHTVYDFEGIELGSFVFKKAMSYYMESISYIRWLSISTALSIIVVIAFLINTLINNYTKRIKEQKEILDYQSNYDKLTTLPNRMLFNDRLRQAVQKAQRQKSELALLFIDLDRFKQINDSLGHAVGDMVLQKISSRLLNAVRAQDTVSRLGGDEFAILIEDASTTNEISFMAQSILNALSEPIEIEGHTLYMTNSIGISMFPYDGNNADDILKNADAAMFKAKDEGRNNFQYYSSEMTHIAYERVVMEAELRKAINNGEFVLAYQPQINGVSSKIIGIEALVRWQHPEKGLVCPDKFIPLAQETGLIVPIDRIVIKNALFQMASWHKDGVRPGVLAINVSMKQLAQDDFIEFITQTINESGCKAKWLELEVTESDIMKNPETAIEKLKAISDLGIEIAIDDFGTGYSSLSYLKRLPLDKLKIDKSFVDGLPTEDEDIGIARAVIALARSLKLSVIAEGVETKEQKDFLVENGCSSIQGYYYSKAIEAKELEEILLRGGVFSHN